MSEPQNISTMADISANIFALFILVLIILLGAREHASPPRFEQGQAVDIDKDIVSVERSPLSGDDLFDLFYDRSEKASSSIKIDLLDRRIDMTSDGKTEGFDSLGTAVARLNQAAANGRMPASIYVFSHRFYRGITDHLKATGWAWREVSVPQALRSQRFGTADQGWSAGFAALIVQPSNRSRFRAELARLLESANIEEHGGIRGHGGNRTSGERTQTISASLARWSRAALNGISLLGGLFFILWVEIRCGRRMRTATR